MATSTRSAARLYIGNASVWREPLEAVPCTVFEAKLGSAGTLTVPATSRVAPPDAPPDAAPWATAAAGVFTTPYAFAT
ncbi:MAG: hypothetical protein SGJ11_15835 [Phycisphaerae bacterium]|nr:hypothetical protein [Phycisphaerae bacterium]